NNRFVATRPQQEQSCTCSGDSAALHGQPCRTELRLVSEVTEVPPILRGGLGRRIFAVATRRRCDSNAIGIRHEMSPDRLAVAQGTMLWRAASTRSTDSARQLI